MLCTPPLEMGSRPLNAHARIHRNDIIFAAHHRVRAESARLNQTSGYADLWTDSHEHHKQTAAVIGQNALFNFSGTLYPSLWMTSDLLSVSEFLRFEC